MCAYEYKGFSILLQMNFVVSDCVCLISGFFFRQGPGCI